MIEYEQTMSGEVQRPEQQQLFGPVKTDTPVVVLERLSRDVLFLQSNSSCGASATTGGTFLRV